MSVIRGHRLPSQRWSEQDRLIALGYQAYLDDLCDCGYPRTYTTDSGSEGHWHAGDPVRCHACTELSQKLKVVGEGSEIAPDALRVGVRPDEVLRQAMREPTHLQTPLM